MRRRRRAPGGCDPVAPPLSGRGRERKCVIAHFSIAHPKMARGSCRRFQRPRLAPSETPETRARRRRGRTGSFKISAIRTTGIESAGCRRRRRAPHAFRETLETRGTPGVRPAGAFGQRAAVSNRSPRPDATTFRRRRLQGRSTAARARPTSVHRTTRRTGSTGPTPGPGGGSRLCWSATDEARRRDALAMSRIPRARARIKPLVARNDRGRPRPSSRARIKTARGRPAHHPRTACLLSLAHLNRRPPRAARPRGPPSLSCAFKPRATGGPPG